MVYFHYLQGNRFFKHSSWKLEVGRFKEIIKCKDESPRHPKVKTNVDTVQAISYMLFLVRQSFLPTLNYSNSNSLLSVLIAQL